MSLFNFILKLGSDILTKPDSTAAQATKFMINNRELVKSAFDEIFTVTLSLFNRQEAKRKVRQDYNNWKSSPNTIEKQKQKKFFDKINHFVHDKIMDAPQFDYGLERDYDFAMRQGNRDFIGVADKHNLKYLEEVEHGFIEPTFDRELDKDELVLL
jgi:hypothetical protein